MLICWHRQLSFVLLLLFISLIFLYLFSLQYAYLQRWYDTTVAKWKEVDLKSLFVRFIWQIYNNKSEKSQEQDVK